MKVNFYRIPAGPAVCKWGRTCGWCNGWRPSWTQRSWKDLV